jgi:ATP-dependent Clp protease protease subunit
MAKLRIYSDIVTQDEKEEMQFWGMAGGVSFNDVASFCDNLPEDDPDIDVLLHCDGGSVSEGWSIYDRLRATGKNITCIVEGKAHSMATVVLMAAPKEQRKAYENAEILIHNPYCYTTRPLTADALQTLEQDMRNEQNKIRDLYVERCGCDPVAIQEQMDKNIPMNVSKAMEFGLIGEVLSPMSAKHISEKFDSINPNRKSMEKENVEVKKSLLDKMLEKLGFKSVEEVKFGMALNTADGATVEVEREEGEPQVGDKAAPDGEFLMPDGTTIVVENGEIVEIKPAAEAEQSEEDDILEQDDDKAEIERLKSENDDLKAQIEQLKQELEDAKKNAKTTDDLRILNAVKIAGGEKALKAIESNYKPEGRKKEDKRAEEAAEGKAPTSAEILARLKEIKKGKKK